jgi:hypothetical protein
MQSHDVFEDNDEGFACSRVDWHLEAIIIITYSYSAIPFHADC